MLAFRGHVVRRAKQQRGFRAITSHRGPLVPRIRIARGEIVHHTDRRATAKLPAHNLSIVHVPLEATHFCAHSEIVDFHVACTAVGPVGQTHLQLLERQQDAVLGMCGSHPQHHIELAALSRPPCWWVTRLGQHWACALQCMGPQRPVRQTHHQL